jgi:hypothetical protein
MLDGGNAISYWNHLMGRHGLTGISPTEALTLFASHNVTHLLIDSTDIGKYGAFSSIGSDAAYDRQTYVPTFIRAQKAGETKTGTTYLYQGGFALDEDIVYADNDSSVLLPSGVAGIGGFIVEFNATKQLSKQPIALVVHQGKQYMVKVRYAYQANKLHDFGSGIDAGLFLYSRFANQNGATGFEEDGAALFLSPRAIHSQIARLYLFNEQLPGFTLVHQQGDKVLTEIARQNPQLGTLTFVNDEIYAGTRGSAFAGPIKIWEIAYPTGQQINKTYIQTTFPDKRVSRA